MKKEECLKLLKENEIYKNVLNQATDSKEKRIISAYAEDFINRFFRDVFEPINKAIENDPDLLNKAILEIEKGLINNSSGSQEEVENVNTTE